MATSARLSRRLAAGGLLLLSTVTAACGAGAPAAPAGTQSVSPSASATQPSAPVPTVSPPGEAPQAPVPVPVESNPPGDIPDNLAFVPYRNRAGGYRFTYPEGWARVERGTAVTFTDKLNGIQADTAAAPEAPTVQGVRAQEVPRLQQAQPAFELRIVEPVTLPAGKGVRVVYRRNSAEDPVTGRQVRDEVESYLVTAPGGRSLRLDLFGPVGADNVDAYRTISHSLELS